MVRKVTVKEIQAVGELLLDENAIDILKDIRENIYVEEDLKGKKKDNDLYQFVGFAHEEDVLGDDPESEEYKTREGLLNILIDSGLVLSGYHVPLARKSKKKFGDINVPDAKKRIGKYNLTSEGLAALALVEKQEQKQTSGSKKSATATPKARKKVVQKPDEDEEEDESKNKQIENFKKDYEKDSKA